MTDAHLDDGDTSSVRSASLTAAHGASPRCVGRDGYQAGLFHAGTIGRLPTRVGFADVKAAMRDLGPITLCPVQAGQTPELASVGHTSTRTAIALFCFGFIDRRMMYEARALRSPRPK